MTKRELIRVFMERFNLSDSEAAYFVNIFFERIRQGLRDGERVELRGFGTFKIRDYEGYTGRNPKTGVAIVVPPKRLPFFKAGVQFKKYLND